MSEKLIEKIGRRDACITVVGLGHIGLPTACIFADAGFQVKGADTNQKVVQEVSSGRSHIKEAYLSEIVKRNIRNGRLRATTDAPKATKEADVVIICVQTSLAKDKKPDLTHLQEACRAVAKGLSKGKLVIVESTVPPGATKGLIAPILERESGLKCGEDFWLSHCPERLLPGRALRELTENPRIIGAYDQKSAEITAKLLREVTKGEILLTDPTSAETAKLAENTFRDVNIALANELALICEQVGADVMEVIRLANTHPRVNIHKPGCGVGGPCLPKDPHLLLSSAKGYRSKIIEASRQLNDHMPKHTVELAMKSLREVGKEARFSKVAVLGTAYKGETSDARNSPAEGIVHELMNLGAKVVVYDPHCEESFEARKAESIEEAIREADCLIVTTDHKMFKRLDLRKIKKLMKDKPIIIDGRRIIDPEEAKKKGFTYHGIGYEPKCPKF